MTTTTKRGPDGKIRVGLIGLSGSALTSWAAGAHLPYLLSEPGREKYTIVALCNSSVAAAQAAIAEYKLDPATKAYGNPQDLANDADVDLAVSVTRVDKHHQTIVPSLKAGKAAYVEWPLTANLADTDELVQLAQGTGAGTVVGLQGRFAAPVAKVRETIESGRFGKVLSSNVRFFESAFGRDSVPAGFEYFTRREVGGNPITILFAHVIDWIQYSLGEIKPETLQARAQIQHKVVKLVDAAEGGDEAAARTVENNVPDLLTLHGALPASARVASGATLSVYFGRGKPSFGDAALTWSVVCERGEMQLVATTGAHIQAYAGDDSISIRVQDYASDRVEAVPWAWPEAEAALPVLARSVARQYEAFAAGEREGWVSFEDAAARAQQVQRLMESLDG